MQQNEQAEPRCPSEACYWPAAPVVTRGVEATQLNGEHAGVPPSCRRFNPPEG